MPMKNSYGIMALIPIQLNNIRSGRLLPQGRGKSMLAQAVMPVVIALTEKITLGMQECMTAE